MRYNKDLAAKELNEAEKEKIAFKESTDRKKQQFISELKSGLGSELKTNPGKIKIIKPTKIEKLRNWLKSIFTKF
jgi:hypothetical protein